MHPIPMNIRPRYSRGDDVRRDRRGFTILEIAVVLAIMGIVTAIALPAFERMQRNSRLSALGNDLRVLAGAFQHYNAATGGWPPLSTEVGIVPAGMQDYLRDTNWTRQTAFGGGYVWERNVTHNGRKVRAAIALQSTEDSPVRMTSAEFARFDEQFDDGNPATGFIQAGYLDLPLYVIEDDPDYVAATTPGADTAAEAAAKAAEEAAAAKAAEEAAAQAAAEAAAAEAAAKEAAAKEAAAAEAAAAEAAAKEAAAKEAAVKALQTAQATAAANLATDLTRYQQLVAWADKLDVKGPKNVENRLDDLKDAVKDYGKASVDTKNLNALATEVDDAREALDKALDQFEKQLQAAQERADKRKK